jgi:hypothetical protein
MTTTRIRSLSAIIVLLTAAFTLGLVLSSCGRAASAAQAPLKKTSMTLTILDQAPDGHDGPLYDNTNIVLPAHTLVTMTIINKDPGEDALPAGSPYGAVKGTTDSAGKANNTAYLSGRAYNALALDKMSHTFTVPQLGINVPIPGTPAPGQKEIAVTFSFVTGGAGKYTFQCLVPCGDGPSGYDGPMAMKGFMMGTLTVQG